jgi:uncharacterized protein
MQFEWDARKNAQNVQDHGIDFEAAKLIFDGPVLEHPDDRFDYGEERIIAIGMLETREIVVVYTDRDSVRRLISARRAVTDERKAYYQAFPDLYETGPDQLAPRGRSHRRRDQARRGGRR